MSRAADPSSRKTDLPSPAEALPLAARRHPVVTAVAHGLSNSCGVPSEARIMLGVSGGADSTALLLACAALRNRREGDLSGFDPHVVHVNHHLRASADDEAQWVADLCDKLNVPCTVIDIGPAAARGNLEASARRLRYDAMVSEAKRVNAPWVAVAHHAEDQLETMLMALCRGAGLDGLSGMSWRRSLDDAVQLVRPLLGTRRAECEELCRAAGVQWREDPTNADVTRARARLRRDVLPVLEELWPDAPRRASTAAEMIGIARDLVSLEIEAMFGPQTSTSWPREALAGEPVPIIAAGLRRAALALAGQGIADDLGARVVTPAAEAIHSADRQPREFHWPGNLLLTVTSRLVELSKR